MADTIKCSWEIECKHTPETIDRIMLPIRKRGLMVSSFEYLQKDAHSAIAKIVFEAEAAGVDRIFKNMQRIYDIIEVKAS